MDTQCVKRANDEAIKTLIFPESKWIVAEGNEQGNRNHFVREQSEKVIQGKMQKGLSHRNQWAAPFLMWTKSSGER